ncbi:MAG: sugar ABC transporter permease [Anaerolineae bacterium]|nr:sugar ABC transporter permease [Anaerolineae bacterium]
MDTTGRGRPRFSWLTDRWLAGLFVSPTLIILLFIAIYPLIWSLSASFTDRTLLSRPDQINSVGFENYVDLLNDNRAWQRFVVTAQIVVPSVLIELLLGFAVAMLLNRKFGGRGVIMTVILIPMMLSPVVVALFWRFMMQGDGILNYYIQALGGQPVLWLSSPSVIPWSVVLVDVWMWTPFMMLIALAGLSAVPKYLYEAAEVDRAGAWFRFRHITLPIVTPLLMIGIIFRTMDAYKMIDTIFVLVGDRGGAGRAAQTAGLYVYDTAIKGFDTGVGSAYGYIMLVVIIALANLLIRQLNKVKG